MNVNVVMSGGAVVSEPNFPFTLDDLDYWIIEREDGTVTKFTVDNRKEWEGSPKPSHSVGTSASTYVPAVRTSLSAYCLHHPSYLPVFSTPDFGVNLFIADAVGTRAHKSEFDLVIDCGDILTLYKGKPLLNGDPELCSDLEQFAIYGAKEREPKVLQIDWWDRKAPPLDPAFWPYLAERLAKDDKMEDILCSCQGGHGRSGSSMVALMMCYTDYTPLDAIAHLRAIHCPRAIESVVQHDYLNLLAKHLGREENSHESQKVSDFREKFLSITSPHAKPYQERLQAQMDGKMNEKGEEIK